MSTKRLLITAGCSFTEQCSYYKWLTWPGIIAHDNGMDLLNLGKSGASNSYIENIITDAVIEHKDKDPLVMVLWSQPRRVNINDLGTLLRPAHCLKKSDITWYEDPDNLEGVYKNLKASLRSMWRTKNLVESYKIDYAHDIGLWQINLDDWPDKPPRHTLRLINSVLEKIKDNWYFQNLDFTNSDIKTAIWGRYSQISKDDDHPDAKGQEWLADLMINKYTKRFEEVNFIYD